MNHQPKGGMCATCAHAHRNCSHLPFSTMPPLSNDGQTVIVRCTDFLLRSPKPNPYPTQEPAGDRRSNRGQPRLDRPIH